MVSSVCGSPLHLTRGLRFAFLCRLTANNLPTPDNNPPKLRPKYPKGQQSSIWLQYAKKIGPLFYAQLHNGEFYHIAVVGLVSKMEAKYSENMKRNVKRNIKETNIE